MALLIPVAFGYATLSPAEQALLHEFDRQAQANVRSPLQQLSDTLAESCSGIRRRLTTAYEIGVDVHNGRFGKLSAEIIEALVVELSGDRTAHYKAGGAEFDERTLKRAVDGFMEKFFQYLRRISTKRGDLYGVTQSGEYVAIFDNKTVLGLFADHIIPASVPLRGIAVAALNKPIIERSVRAQLNGIALKLLRQLAESRGTTLKAAMGDAVDASLRRAFTRGQRAEAAGADDDEAADDGAGDEIPAEAGPLWQYLKPRLTHIMREFMIENLRRVRNTAFEQADRRLRPTLVWGAASVGAAAGQVAGAALQALGPCIPVLGVPVSALGASLSSSVAGSLAGAGFGAWVMTSTCASTERKLRDISDRAFERWAFQALGYSAEEHALYALNEDASEMERALLADDYNRRDDLKGRYFVVEMLKQITPTGVSGLYDMLKGSAKTVLNAFTSANITAVNALEASGLSQYIDHDRAEDYNARERALRTFYTLPESERAEIQEAIKAYPSYAMKMVELTGEPVPARETNTRAKVGNLRMILGVLISRAIPTEHRNEPLEKEFFDFIFNEFSVREQDLILEHYINRRGFVNVERLQPKIYDFVSERRRSFINKADDSINTDNLRAFFQEIIAEINGAYVSENEDQLSQLAAHSLCEGMHKADVVSIHKALVAKGDGTLERILDESAGDQGRPVRMTVDTVGEAAAHRFPSGFDKAALLGDGGGVAAQSGGGDGDGDDDDDDDGGEPAPAPADQSDPFEAADNGVATLADSFEVLDATPADVRLSQELATIRRYHQNLVAKQTAMKLLEIFERQMRDCGVVAEVREAAQRRGERDGKIVFGLIIQNKTFCAIRESISIVRGTSTAMKNIFNPRRDFLLYKIVDEIIASVPDAAADRVAVLDADAVRAKVQAHLAEGPLSYEGDKDVMGEMNLKELIEAAELRTDAATYAEYGDEEFRQLLAHNRGNKLDHLDDDERNFFYAHENEIWRFVEGQDYYKSRIFYSLRNVINQMRARNAQLLRSLFAPADGD